MNSKLFFGLVVAMLFPIFMQGQACMEPSGDEGVQLIGYIQPQYEYTFLGNDPLGTDLDETGFYFNRARLGVTGQIPYDFSYYAILELSPTLGGPYLLDAFISYNRYAPYVKASVGQFKSPFGLELGTPCHKLHTIDRSEVVNQLAGPFRDFGLMIHGTTGKLKIFGSEVEDFFGYKLAVMNGTGLNTPDDNRQKDIIGRFTVHPFNFITLGASYRHGIHPAQSITAEQDDERNRFGFDVELKHNNMILQGEFIHGQDKGSTVVGGGCGKEPTIVEGSTDRNGFMVQAMYMTKWNIQPVFKFENFDPNLDMTANDIGATFHTSVKNTMTFGINYFFNEWTRMQVNYLYRAEENGKVEVPNDALLVQFQVVF